MKDALQEAGVDTEGARLAVLAWGCLKQANRNAIVAADPFAEKVAADNGLLLSLVSASERRALTAAIMKLAIPYLQKRASDMAHEIGGASQNKYESQTRVDRAPDANVPASQHAGASHGSIDRRDQAGGPSLSLRESQPPADRPARRPKAKAPGTRLNKATVRAVVKSAFDDRLGFDLTVRTATWDDWIILEKKSGAYNELTHRIAAHPGWSPDPEIRAKQRTPDAMSEDEYKALKSDVWRSRDALGLTNVQL